MGGITGLPLRPRFTAFAFYVPLRNLNEIQVQLSTFWVCCNTEGIKAKCDLLVLAKSAVPKSQNVSIFSFSPGLKVQNMKIQPYT